MGFWALMSGMLPRLIVSDAQSEARTTIRKAMPVLAGALFTVMVLTGCASTKVTSGSKWCTRCCRGPITSWLHDFGATPAEVPADSTLAGQGSAPATPPTPEQAALAREWGVAIAAQLVEEIRKMDCRRRKSRPGATPKVNDIVIRGYLVSVDKGSALKRMTIGFGSGGSELTTFVEGYQMTDVGLRKLGSGTLESKGAKGPGAGLGAAGWLITGSPIGLVVSGGMKVYGEASGSSKVEGRAKATAKEIGDALKVRFQEQGWIAGKE